ncbi:MAG TPA: prepilin-type N-terminal cleavage/methylation domain-containing protein [Phycisphaerae bacterium]|nr:prepilin-type N-terminal cleavage/methylation domain-containing protein [Phycisphaerae bacterium]HRY71252.1 prepilin-type N-terminal cleavage/methylation domain-containing protein [Phycisphaerae bacterium]HSA29668.1 prepilin-type N-terminal cleavage/methylation domain-containing protein [Phycisphaerae bacterium]
MSVRRSTGSVAAARGFTLPELLVTVGIIAVLVAILSVSISKVRNAGRTVMCMNNLKTVNQEFFRFADDSTRTYRGDSEQTGKLFRLEDFQEKLYRVDEFWDAGESSEIALDKSKLPLACPAASGILTKRKSLPCSENAIVPLENISTAFNMRLDRASTIVRGWPVLQRTRLTTRILEYPDVPLAFGVDGAQATRNSVLPYYSAPPAGDSGLYGAGKFWFPSLRHEGKLNVAFIGGYVLRTTDPGNSPKSNWKYQPPLQ